MRFKNKPAYDKKRSKTPIIPDTDSRLIDDSHPAYGLSIRIPTAEVRFDPLQPVKKYPILKPTVNIANVVPVTVCGCFRVPRYT